MIRRIRIRIRTDLQMTSQNVYNMSLFENRLKVLILYLEVRIRIRIRIRIKIDKLDPDPDPHQFADDKPKCKEYEYTTCLPSISCVLKASTCMASVGSMLLMFTMVSSILQSDGSPQSYASNYHYTSMQCCGSVTFSYGSGSADPCL